MFAPVMRLEDSMQRGSMFVWILALRRLKGACLLPNSVQGILLQAVLEAYNKVEGLNWQNMA